MIVGIPNKLSLFVRARAVRRTAGAEQNNPRIKREKTPQPGPVQVFGRMMERQADILIRQMGE